MENRLEIAKGMGKERGGVGIKRQHNACPRDGNVLYLVYIEVNILYVGDFASSGHWWKLC